MYIYSYIYLCHFVVCRNWHNIVNQLYCNKKKRKDKKVRGWKNATPAEFHFLFRKGSLGLCRSLVKHKNFHLLSWTEDWPHSQHPFFLWFSILDVLLLTLIPNSFVQRTLNTPLLWLKPHKSSGPWGGRCWEETCASVVESQTLLNWQFSKSILGVLWCNRLRIQHCSYSGLSCCCDAGLIPGRNFHMPWVQEKKKKDKAILAHV